MLKKTTGLSLNIFENVVQSSLETVAIFELYIFHVLKSYRKLLNLTLAFIASLQYSKLIFLTPYKFKNQSEGKVIIYQNFIYWIALKSF